MWLRWLRSASLLILFPSFPEAFQALPALRDICDGPVDTSTWTGCPLSGCKAAGHLLLSRHEVLPGLPASELELECEVLDVLEVPGSSSSRRM